MFIYEENYKSFIGNFFSHHTRELFDGKTGRIGKTAGGKRQFDGREPEPDERFATF
jgi:hypothetical protein